MGTQVDLCWMEEGQEKWMNVLKWSYYPYYWDKFILEKHPEPELNGGNMIKNLDLLMTFKEWLLHLQFLFKYVKELNVTLGGFWDTREGYLQSIEQDLKEIEKAICKARILELEGKNPYMTIG